MKTIEDLHEHYKNVRARINNAAKQQKQVEAQPKPKPEICWKDIFDNAKEKYGVVRNPYMNIIQEICEEHNLEREILFSKSRKRHIVIARSAAFYRIRQELNWSYPKIARLFNNHHTTVMHGIKIVQKYKS